MFKKGTLIGYQNKLCNINPEEDVYKVLQKDGNILFHNIPSRLNVPNVGD
jgi:hypothetical protein